MILPCTGETTVPLFGLIATPSPIIFWEKTGSGTSSSGITSPSIGAYIDIALFSSFLLLNNFLNIIYPPYLSSFSKDWTGTALPRPTEKNWGCAYSLHQKELF